MSFSIFIFGFLVCPKEIIFEFFKFNFLTLLKYSSSLGLEPANPPSIKSTPSSSNFFVINIFSSRDKFTPLC